MPPSKDPGDESGANQVNVKAHQIEPGKRHVLGAEHHRQDEISQDRRDGRDDEHEHHHRAVQAEHVVVKQLRLGVVRRIERRVGRVARKHPVIRRQQRRAQKLGESSPEQKCRQHEDHVHQPDPLVIERQCPGQKTPAVRQIIIRLRFVMRYGCMRWTYDTPGRNCLLLRRLQFRQRAGVIVFA